MREPETDTVHVTILDETEKAFRFRNDNGDESWFPKSEVTFNSRNVKTYKAVAVIPIWLLEKNCWE